MTHTNNPNGVCADTDHCPNGSGTFKKTETDKHPVIQNTIRLNRIKHIEYLILREKEKLEMLNKEWRRLQ